MTPILAVILFTLSVQIYEFVSSPAAPAKPATAVVAEGQPAAPVAAPVAK